MVAKAKQGAKAKRSTGKSVRTSVTLPRDAYETLAQLAKGKRVTVAWVIRDAAEQYIAAQWPLLGGSSIVNAKRIR